MGITIIPAAGGGGGSCPTLDGDALSSYSLTSAWTFDDAGAPLEDSQSPGYNLTLGGSTPTYSVSGKRGTAIQFASDTHYYQAASAFQPTGDLTLNIWVKFSSVSTENRILTWTSDITSDSEQVGLYMNSSGALVICGDSDATLDSGGSFTADRWAMVTFVRSSTTWTAYLNGVETATSSTQGSDDLSTWSLYIGRQVSVYAPSATMDAPVYYKAALSVNAILELFANGNGLMINDTAIPTISGGTDLPNYIKYLHSAWKHDEVSGDLVEELYGVNDINYVSGTATYEAGGIDGTSIQCDSDPIWAHTDSLFEYIGTGTFTLNCWIYVTNTTLFKELWNITADVTSFDGLLTTISSSETIWLRGDTSATTRVSSSIFTTSAWHMVTVKRTLTNTELFLDAVSQGTTTEFNGVDISSRDFYLGRTGTSRGDGYRRDEMHFFSTAISDTAISDLYNSGTGRFVAAAA